jgi:hypothetical protein
MSEIKSLNDEATRKELAELLAGDILDGLNDAVKERLPLDNAEVVLKSALNACKGKQAAVQQAHELGNMRLRFHRAHTLMWERMNSPRASAEEKRILDEAIRALLGDVS